ncbi:TetR/AcrR family transcriptional regulator [Nocardia bovistercoris]|uniref:TetR/AcrR family transcriptional regulator n=1 Tax=Nocardia bovistercoris TaxID=2785916 RepID=UPI001E49A621|nr:TetR/AcrR family transcriptional regulator [Nocardia bovistercoris]
MVRAAVALWRKNGYAATTVADISSEAGVSEALFYFYYPSKEDLLFELGAQSTRDVQIEIEQRLREPYELADVIVAALTVLEKELRLNPPELIIEAVLEATRQEHRTQASLKPYKRMSPLFGKLFERARADGKLSQRVDVRHLATLTQAVVSDGTRRWVAGAYGDRSYALAISDDVNALVIGFNQLAEAAGPDDANA